MAHLVFLVCISFLCFVEAFGRHGPIEDTKFGRKDRFKPNKNYDGVSTERQIGQSPMERHMGGKMIDVLYIAGGIQIDKPSGCFDEATLAIAYDLQNGKWCKVKRSLPLELQEFSMAYFQEKLFFVGGMKTVSMCDGVCGMGWYETFNYDVINDTFSPIMESSDDITYDAIPIVMDSDKLAIFSSNGHVLNYENGKFSRAPDSQINNRMSFSATNLNNKVIFTGGQNFDHPFEGTPLVDIFDVASGKWSTGPNMTTGRYNHASVAIGNSIFVCGGSDPQDAVTGSCERLDLKDDGTVSDTWIPVAPMALPREQFGLFEYNGKVLAVSGNWQFSIESYDVEKDKWTPNYLAPYPVDAKNSAGYIIAKLPESAMEC